MLQGRNGDRLGLLVRADRVVGEWVGGLQIAWFSKYPTPFPLTYQDQIPHFAGEWPLVDGHHRHAGADFRSTRQSSANR
jgi:hypothetical protein